MNEKTVLELRGVSKSYPLGHLKVGALNNVNLRVRRGEFTALVGPSGSGKTTLLNLVGCLDLPDEGTIHFAGQEIQNASKRQRALIRGQHIGFIFQTFNLIPVLTARENVEYPLILGGHYHRAKGNELKELRERPAKLLTELGLEEYINRKPDDMSGGQRQRVAIARSLVSKPDIVLADEPTANLDTKTSTEIMNLLRKFNREHGSTFLLATHDPLVIGFASRVITLVDGSVAKDEVTAETEVANVN
jgi:putative ABC transport system ATP-binding protein